ncbi:hypothetical protein HMPREF0239_03123 [Clostridium sp. ATCC BAA-442]|uniref:Uncharacterized protein n=1 Tax=Flavonifractor plautii ATCC 29863 TaxID=411475 RepID=G9YQ21_FLAPL|nr:hypothetical protein HMPREF0372_01614 [Flavonifractor plautii ATCC 29863]ERI72727.1 hypothetical protein HMPREF0239_03123 [Clostridium sp. ATCC BAA-442]
MSSFWRFLLWKIIFLRIPLWIVHSPFTNPGKNRRKINSVRKK